MDLQESQALKVHQEMRGAKDPLVNKDPRGNTEKWVKLVLLDHQVHMDGQDYLEDRVSPGL